ncbi:MAG: lytic murein transglycosylase [Hyphomonadaceae bacterium JAD_PAG50586_4]|nr:MAG: lytic murein transglycosylase [Hyphomonadaceae bacterium JAD_PAG50586_4]
MASPRFVLVALASLLALCVATAAQAQTLTFEAWRADFIVRAVAEGRSQQSLELLFADISPDETVLARQRAPSSYTPPMWNYMETRISPARVARGRELLATHRELLLAIEQRYGVPGEIILAVWGMETRFGEASLDYDARRSIISLAYAGLPRRRAEFERHALALADMIEAGIAPDALASASWDGGMGQPQFMPASFLPHAVDWNSDGQRDIWNNIEDALASIASYLKNDGWRGGAPILIETENPAGMTRSFGPGRFPARVWYSAGLVPFDTPDHHDDMPAALLQPDGAAGPAFLTFSNFEVLTRYNGARRYGFATALLARAIADEPMLRTPWRRPSDALGQAELLEAQTLLASFGYDVGPADGIWGERSWRALNAFADDISLPHADYPRQIMLVALRDRASETHLAPH